MLFSEELLLDLELSRLLTRLDGKPKSNLGKASEKLLAEIRGVCKLAAGCPPVSIVGFHNLGALLQFSAGEFKRAEQICRHAIRVCQTLAEEDSFARWAAYMIQPYINLGRIAAATGRCDESLASFHEVFRFVRREDDLRLHGYRIPSEKLDELVREDSSFCAVGTNVYAADSIRAFLSSEDYRGLLQFTESLAEQPLFEQGSFPYTLMEGRARALAGLNQHKEALDTLRKFVQRMSRDTVRYGSIYTLIADIYRKAGMPRDANKMLDLSETYMRVVRTKSGFCPEFLRTTHLIAVQQALLGERDRAALNARLALEAAQSLGDEVGQLKALSVLINSVEGPARADSGVAIEEFGSLCQMLDNLTRCTGYQYERVLGYVQLAETGGLTEEVGGPACLRRAHVILKELHQYCVGGRKKKLSAYLSLIEQLRGERQMPETAYWFSHHDTLSKLYDELMGLEPARILQLTATA
jgi:tetratricopeptide (TPR) repeat protein